MEISIYKQMFAWYDGLRYKIGLYLTQTEERNADDKLQKALEAVN